MRKINKIPRILLFILFLAGCTIQFNPEAEESKEMLVVEGMITDQFRTNTVRLSRSLPLGRPMVRKPVRGAAVTITDENGIVTTLKETSAGNYTTDSTKFCGHVGGKYALNVRIVNTTYSTDLTEMKPVPSINSLYYEKVTISGDSRDSSRMEQGCRIYLDSFDPTGRCLFFRWDYTETYEYKIPYEVVNKKCWVTEQSDKIIIKNTSIYNQARVTKFPLEFIDNYSDKLKEEYSILVNQYSLNEEEYNFWEKLQNVSQNVGGLYDVTPMAIQGNIKCDSNPQEEVLGYFCVSAVTQKRLFIKDTFLGLPLFYSYCATDTLRGILPQEGLNRDYWIIQDFSDEAPPYWVVTTYRECADCTTRGTRVRPDFWITL